MEFNNFTNELLKDYTDETTEPVTEAAATTMTQDDIGDFFYEDYAAAMYVAREITYDLVSDEATADALLAKAEDWEDDEYLALESLIVDALEGANEHYAAMHYRHNVGLAIGISDRVDAKGKAIADKILADTTNDKVSILFLAVNALVVNGYLY